MGGCLGWCKKKKPSTVPELPSFRKFDETDSVEVTLNQTSFSSTYLFDEFSPSRRSELISKANTMLREFDQANFDLICENRGANCYFKETRVKYEQKPNSAEYFHNYYTKEIVGFDPLTTLFFELNTDVIDTNTDYYKVIKQESTPDTLLIFYEAKTKKVLMIQPRVTLVLRFVRYISEHSVLDIQISAEVMGLQDHPEVKEHFEKAGDQLASIHLVASRLRGMGPLTVKYSAAKMDVHSSVGLALTRPFISSNQKKYSSKIPQEIDDFYKKKKYQDGRNVIWFNDDYEKLFNRYTEQSSLNEAAGVTIDQRSELQVAPEVQAAPNSV